MYAQLKIKKLSNVYKLYVFCSKNPESINSISKVRALQPTIIIDESIASTEIINGVEYYVVPDKQDVNLPGVTWNGPKLNIIPTTEYETSVEVVKINDYTYANKLILNELITPTTGVMLYYSVIGIDESQTVNGGNPITHLSKAVGVLMKSSFKTEGTRHIYSCENNTDSDTDVWNYVSSCSWDEDIVIGDFNNDSNMKRFGNPFVAKVPMFNNDDIIVHTKPLANNNFIVLEVLNPWKKNNETYNYRKLKSFKVQNVYDEQYSDFSLPTYQSLLPVSIEKMIIIEQRDATDSTSPYPMPYLQTTASENFHVYEVVRKDGLYYNILEHKKLGFNKWNIPIEETRFQRYIISGGSIAPAPYAPEEVIPLIPTQGGGLIIGDPEQISGIGGAGSSGNTGDSTTIPAVPIIPPSPAEKIIGVFSEGSVQDTIKMQLEAFPAHSYKYTVYLLDVYGNLSDPAFVSVNL